MSRQVVLRGVGGERVGVLVVRVLAAVVGRRLARQGDAGVVVRVDGLAEVDGVLELLLQHLPARVARQLEQEEAGVRLGQEVIRRVVLVQHLGDGGSEEGRETGQRERKENEINIKTGKRKTGERNGEKTEGKINGGKRKGEGRYETERLRKSDIKRWKDKKK